MNVYGVVVLTALLVEMGLTLASELSNLRALRAEPPDTFRDLVDSERWRRARAYTRARTHLSLLRSVVELAAVLAFWFGGGFGWLDRSVRGWTDEPLTAGLVYIGALALARALLALPFRVYAVFGVEARFGFNRSTPGLFATDVAKSLALGALLGGPLLAAVLAFFQHAGPYAWLYAWGATALFVLALQVLVPTVILPLFNEFTPLRDAELREAIQSYARSVDFPLEDVFVMDGSRRSTRSNAFFTGVGRHKRVVLFDTLVERHARDELVAVLAHEIGHFKLGHILQGTAASIVHLGALFALLSVFLSHEGLFTAFKVEQPSVYVGLVLFGLLFAPVEIVLSIGLNALSRHNERQADRFAARTTGAPEQLAEALRKLAVHNLSDLTPHPLHVFLNASHPPVTERVTALRRA